MENHFLEIIDHLIHVYGGSPNQSCLNSKINLVFF